MGESVRVLKGKDWEKVSLINEGRELGRRKHEIIGKSFGEAQRDGQQSHLLQA